MSYTVSKKFKIRPEYAFEIPHSTLEEFKENVLMESTKNEEYYIQKLRDANMDGWSEREAEFVAVRANKNESFDEETKEYTVTRTWDSFEQWQDYSDYVQEANLINEFVVYHTEELLD